MNNTPNNPNSTPRPARAVRRPAEPTSSPPQAVQPQAVSPQTVPTANRPVVRRPQNAGAVNAIRQPGQTPAAQSRPAAASTPQRPAARMPAAQPSSGQQPTVQRPAPQPTTVQRTPAQGTPVRSVPTQHPQPTRAPQPARASQAARTPQPARAPQPTQRPQPARVPEPARAPEPTRQLDLAQNAAVVDSTATRRMTVTPPAGQKLVNPAPAKAGQTDKKTARTDEKKKKKQMSEGAATLLSIVKAITYIVFVIVLAGFLSYYTIMVANDMFAFVKSDEQVSVTIPENATIYDVSEVLAGAEIITYPDVFELYAKLNKDNGKFVAGEYEINAMMNYDELLMVFKEKVVRERIRLTIPEGYTVDEIIDLFIENGVGLVERTKDNWVPATREDYIEAVNNLELYAEYFDFVRALISNTSSDRDYLLEGYLFPDTYEFYTDSKPSQIIYKLLNRFNNVFKEEFYTRASELGYTVDEIIVLASMIEKETRLYHEFEKVSSVFHNRLRNAANYPYLESDATIMYAIHHDTGTRKDDMTHDDLSYVSPYNTYTNRGLPPGPIANPSYQAITCALYPEETDYYYFVSRKNGETIFSKTFPEHQAAVAEVAREG